MPKILDGGTVMKRLMHTVLLCSCIAFTPCVVDADVIALKRDSGLTFNADIIGNGATRVDTLTPANFHSATVMAGTAFDTVLADAGNPIANNRWDNFGAAGQTTFGSFGLLKFDLAAVPGLLGGTVNSAYIRIASNNGNTDNILIGPVTSFDWEEGNKAGVDPGVSPAAPGASMAHPTGLNTGPNQDAAGGTSGPLVSWGSGNDFFFPDPLSDPALGGTNGTYDVSPTDGDTPGDGNRAAEVVFSNTGAGEAWHVANVTDIVTDWVNGDEENFGFYFLSRDPSTDAPRIFNWVFFLSEQSTIAPNSDPSTAQPVLFIDFEPFVELQVVPEPASIAIWSLFGLGLCGYGYRRWRRAG